MGHGVPEMKQEYCRGLVQMLQRIGRRWLVTALEDEG